MRSRTDGVIEDTRRKDHGKSLANSIGEIIVDSKDAAQLEQTAGPLGANDPRRRARLRLDYPRSTSKETPTWPKPTIDITSEGHLPSEKVSMALLPEGSVIVLNNRCVRTEIERGKEICSSSIRLPYRFETKSEGTLFNPGVRAAAGHVPMKLSLEPQRRSVRYTVLAAFNSPTNRNADDAGKKRDIKSRRACLSGTS
ncbi:hypothetical protein FRC00_002413 [Tulasnella sp. 408]|nr:hypothetical protein FRC00_002413 [Tulasnella sp. 408]